MWLALARQMGVARLNASRKQYIEAMPPISFPSTDLSLQEARCLALGILATRIGRAEALLVFLVDDWLASPDPSTFETAWNNMLDDHGIANADRWMASMMPSGTKVPRAPALPAPPRAGIETWQKGRLLTWRGYSDIVLCSVTTTLAAIIAGMGVAAWMPDTLTRTAIATVFSMGAAWIADRWLCRTLSRRATSRSRALTEARERLINHCRRTLASVHARFQSWSYHFERCMPLTTINEDAPSSHCEHRACLWKDDLASVLLAEVALGWDGTTAPRSASDACNLLGAGGATSIRGRLKAPGTAWCQPSEEDVENTIRTIEMACMEEMRQSTAQPERSGRFASFINLAMSPFAGLLEVLAGKPRAVARSLFMGSRYLGWNTPEAQWLRHASLLAKGSGLLLIVAPLVATAIDVYVRTRAHRFARANFARARRMRIALRAVIRSTVFTRERQEEPNSRS
ncbi:hypothetical protein [Cupriavidus pauculus]|nr:hypothetical protein [Cupriavidus pauculus]